MPLIHSKKPSAFKKNIETEMEHGKPQKQAVAIAYRLAGEKKAHGGEVKCAHGGRMHCNMGCYDDGGSVQSSTPATSPAQDVSKGFMGATGSSGVMQAMNNLGWGSSSPTPKKKMAEGGEMEEEMPMEEHMDEKESSEDEHELGKILAEELMTAIEHKDHKQIMESIEAIVMNCLSKGEE